MKLVRNARLLKTKALSSLRSGLTAFNSFNEDGRTTTVLLHLQHSCEMLLKAALVQKRIAIFDKKSATSLGFSKCVKDDEHQNQQASSVWDWTGASA